MEGCLENWESCRGGAWGMQGAERRRLFPPIHLVRDGGVDVLRIQALGADRSGCESGPVSSYLWHLWQMSLLKPPLPRSVKWDDGTYLQVSCSAHHRGRAPTLSTGVLVGPSMAMFWGSDTVEKSCPNREEKWVITRGLGVQGQNGVPGRPGPRGQLQSRTATSAEL